MLPPVQGAESLDMGIEQPDWRSDLSRAPLEGPDPALQQDEWSFEEDDPADALFSMDSSDAADGTGQRSKYRGVSYDKKKRKWRVQIKVASLGRSGVSVGYAPPQTKLHPGRALLTALIVAPHLQRGPVTEHAERRH